MKHGDAVRQLLTMTQDEKDKTKARLEGKCLQTEDGCLIFTSAQNGKRGPLFAVSSSTKTSPHRAAWVLAGKPIGPTQKVVPTCGDPMCIAHLKAISTKAGGRMGLEARSHAALLAGARKFHDKRAKISTATAAEIRSCDLSCTQIANKYGITRSYAFYIRSGRSRNFVANPFASLLP